MAEAVLTATFTRSVIILLLMGLSLMLTVWYRRKMSDKVDGEPLLAEEALVHAKTDYTRRYGCFYVIHFYVAARDEVVTCDVPYEVWRDVEMKSRGTLTHQGGKFYSFETQGVMYCGDHIHSTNR
jgi:hypothetical protein